MRNFNDYKGENKQKNGANTSDNQAMDMLKNFASKYEGASENDLISAIIKEAENGKKKGTLSNKDIDNFANMLSPMLNGNQKKQLDMIIKKIKNI